MSVAWSSLPPSTASTAVAVGLGSLCPAAAKGSVSQRKDNEGVSGAKHPSSTPSVRQRSSRTHLYVNALEVDVVRRVLREAKGQRDSNSSPKAKWKKEWSGNGVREQREERTVSGRGLYVCRGLSIQPQQHVRSLTLCCCWAGAPEDDDASMTVGCSPLIS